MAHKCDPKRCCLDCFHKKLRECVNKLSDKEKQEWLDSLITFGMGEPTTKVIN